MSSDQAQWFAFRVEALAAIGANDDYRMAYYTDASFYHGVNVALLAAESVFAAVLRGPTPVTKERHDG